MRRTQYDRLSHQQLHGLLVYLGFCLLLDVYNFALKSAFGVRQLYTVCG